MATAKGGLSLFARPKPEVYPKTSPTGDLPDISQVQNTTVASMQMSVDDDDEKDPIKPTEQLFRIEADYGFFPADHTLAQFVNERLNTIFPKLHQAGKWPVVRVLAGKGEGINAEVYEDGTILITPELLAAIGYVEELDFVLLHELSHWVRKHWDYLKENVGDDPSAQAVLEEFSTHRVQEWEADMVAFYMAAEDKRQTNPRGGIILFERLQSLAKDEPGRITWDLVHGNISDRILNLKQAAGAFHFFGLGRRSLTPMDTNHTEIAQAVDRVLSIPSLVAICFEGDSKASCEAKAAELLETASVIRLQALMGYLYEQIKTSMELEIGLPPARHASQNRYQHDRERYLAIFGQAFAYWRKWFSGRFSQLSDEQRLALEICLLETGARVPILTQYRSDPIVLLRSSFREIEEVVQRAARSASEGPTIIEKTIEGLQIIKAEALPVFHENLLEFAGQLMYRAVMDLGAFDDAQANVDVRKYLHQGARLVMAIKDITGHIGIVSPSHDPDTFVARAWADVIVSGAVTLVELSQWQNFSSAPNLPENDYYTLCRNASEAEAMEALMEKFPTSIEASLKSFSETSEVWAEHTAQIEPYVRDNWHVPKLEEQLTRLSAIISELRRERDAGNEILYTNQGHLILLREFAAIIRNMPNNIPIAVVENVFPVPPQSIDDFFSNYTKERFLEYLAVKAGLSGATAACNVAYGAVDDFEEVKPFTPEGLVTTLLFLQAADAVLFFSVAWDQSRFSNKTNLPTKILSRFSLADLERILDAATNPANANEVFGQTTHRSDRDAMLEHCDEFQRSAVVVLARELQDITAPETFFQAVDKFTRRWPIPGVPDSEDDDKAFGDVSYTDACTRIIDQGLALLGQGASEALPQAVFYRRLLTLSFFIHNVRFRIPYQNFLMARLVRVLEFEEALSLVTTDYKPQNPPVRYHVLETLEAKAQREEQFEALKAAGAKWLGAAKTKQGGLLIAEMLLPFLFKDRADREEIFKQLMRSSDEDEDLRRTIAEKWWSSLSEAGLNDAVLSEIGWPASESELRQWSQLPVFIIRHLLVCSVTNRAFEIISPGQVLNMLYQLDMIGRRFLLRFLLAGDNGLLSSAPGRNFMLNELLQTSLESSETDPAFAILKQVLFKMAEAASADEFYLQIEPVIQERFAIPPQRQGGWELWATSYTESLLASEANRINLDINEDLARDIAIADMWSTAEHEQMTEDMDTASPEHLEAEEDFIYDDEIYPLSPEHDDTIGPEILDAYDVVNFIRPYVHSRMLLWMEGAISTHGEAHTIAGMEALTPGWNPQRTQSPRLSPLEFILQAAQQLGAPGVRFLQLMGQMVDIPEEYRDKFLEVYDKMHGQSRVCAWELCRTRAPAYYSQMKRLGDKKGGGSFFTVFETELNDGTREIARMLNPNPRYQKDITMGIIRNAVQKLAQEDSRYRQVLPLVDLLDEWIETELREIIDNNGDPVATDYWYEDDRRFRQTWHGKQPSSAWGDRTIVVPKSRNSGHPFVRPEEYIEGENFTDVIGSNKYTQQEQADLVALATQHYIGQIFGEWPGASFRWLTGSMEKLGPDETLVHSDISPGNLRRTTEGDLAILDRGMYLRFNRDDRRFLGELTKAQRRRSIKAQTQTLLTAFINRLRELETEIPQNHEPLANITPRHIETMAAELAGSGSGDTEELLLHALRLLYREGFKVPLKYTLLFKNINALHRMARQVGLGSLAGALNYKPRPPKAASTGTLEMAPDLQRAISGSA